MPKKQTCKRKRGGKYYSESWRKQFNHSFEKRPFFQKRPLMQKLKDLRKAFTRKKMPDWKEQFTNNRNLVGIAPSPQRKTKSDFKSIVLSEDKLPEGMDSVGIAEENPQRKITSDFESIALSEDKLPEGLALVEKQIPYVDIYKKCSFKESFSKQCINGYIPAGFPAKIEKLKKSQVLLFLKIGKNAFVPIEVRQQTDNFQFWISYYVKK